MTDNTQDHDRETTVESDAEYGDEQTDPESSLLDAVTRRSYLRRGLVVGGTAPVGLPSITGTAVAESYNIDQDFDGDGTSRISEALNHRTDAANALIQQAYKNGPQSHDSNNDEDKRVKASGGTYYPMVYTKGLPVNSYGEVSKANYDTYDSILTNDGTYDNIPQGSGRRFVTPPAAHRFTTEGLDPWLGAMPPAPAWDSSTTAAEMIDAYWMAYLRDRPFQDWSLSRSEKSDIRADIQAIQNSSADPTWLYNSNDLQGSLFKDVFYRESGAPVYVSQFLLHTPTLGNLPVKPKFQVFTQEDYGVTEEQWLNLLEGYGAGGNEVGGAEPFQNKISSPVQSERKFIATPRHLASIVNDRLSYQHFLLTAKLLIEWGHSLDDAVPYSDSGTVLPYVDFGGAGVADMLARVARNALDAAWVHKWFVHQRARPETFGGRVHYEISGSRYGIPGLVTDSQAVKRISSKTGGWAGLPQAYLEGAPTHPSYPSGHSVIAGACVTALKAMLDLPRETQLNSGVLYRASSDGSTRIALNPVNSTTAIQELHKLVSNIGLARCFAGVHYRTDHMYGVLLGEQVAVATMLDRFKYANDKSSGNSPEPKSYTPPSFVRFEDVTDESGESQTLSVTESTLNSLRQRYTNKVI